MVCLLDLVVSAETELPHVVVNIWKPCLIRVIRDGLTASLLIALAEQLMDEEIDIESAHVNRLVIGWICCVLTLHSSECLLGIFAVN